MADQPDNPSNLAEANNTGEIDSISPMPADFNDQNPNGQDSNDPNSNGRFDDILSAARPLEAPSLLPPAGASSVADIAMLDDVELDVTIELGRTEMYIEDVLRLGVGSVVELDKLAGDPVDIYVNQRLVARGEVLVLNDNFCVRINDILSPTPELEQAK